MKILITGGSGLLGQYLNINLSKHHDIFTLYNSHEGNCRIYSSAKVDLTDHFELRKIFSSFSPEIVIHTAAISRPEICDKLPGISVVDININTTKFIAQMCDMNNAKIMFTSTDLVYNGYQGKMLTEKANVESYFFLCSNKIGR